MNTMEARFVVEASILTTVKLDTDFFFFLIKYRTMNELMGKNYLA